jgi:acyl-coenzyme A thioesterase PaaI-like protein
MTEKTTTDDSFPPVRQVSQENLHQITPDWVKQLRSTWGEQVIVPEWQDGEGTENNGYYRSQNGWKGQDLIHSPTSPVYIPEYYVRYGPGTTTLPGLDRGGVGTKLTGWVYFSERAESHKGYCHGGSFCSIMDDVIGWVAFMVTGKVAPWTGFTVQINTSLQKAVPVFSTLMVVAEITRLERRKVYVEAKLIDPQNQYTQHAKADGIVVLNRGVLPPLLESQASDVSMG